MKTVKYFIIAFAILNLSFTMNLQKESNSFNCIIIFNQGFKNLEPVEISLTNDEDKDKKILTDKLIRNEEELSTNIYSFKLPKNEHNNIIIRFSNRWKEIDQVFYISKLDTLYFEINVNSENEFRNIIFDQFVGYYD